ncbi:MAG: hypothetical protein Ct9H300mP23_08970 [Nitrospinota bacterium]|nr:MAG: hypothetical protein Ct9H300mP23_08970 [Nitrospinota bacterium]
MGYLIHNRAFREINSDEFMYHFSGKCRKFFYYFKDFFLGGSVTMPAKEKIMPLLITLTHSAKYWGCQYRCSGRRKMGRL